MADTGPFSVGEKVLVPHTDKFYEAKVQKAQRREDGMWYYHLHYLGWNKKWDEWVEETGLRRPGEPMDLSAAGTALTAAGPGGGPGMGGPGVGGGGGPGGGGSAGPSLGGGGPGSAGGKAKSKQRKAGVSGDTGGGVLGGGGGGAGAAAGAGADSAEAPLQMELPPALQKQLLDQYDAIHDDNKLLQLPRRPNVQQVFQQYVQYVREKQGVSQAEEDLVAGLTVYFDKALYQCLLFKAERQQAEAVLAAGQAPSAVYGAEHLLRLIAKLPELLPHTGASDEALQLLGQRVEDLLTYLQIQAERIFMASSGYVAPDGGYFGGGGAAAAAAAVRR